MEEYIKWECIVCGLIYDEAEGWPEDGIEPGTKWEDVPFDLSLIHISEPTRPC